MDREREWKECRMEREKQRERERKREKEEEEVQQTLQQNSLLLLLE
jgi:hypothetical protein